MVSKGQFLTTFGIINFSSSILESPIICINGAIYVIGKSDHQRFHGGGIAVPNSFDTRFICSQSNSNFLRNVIQFLFLHFLSLGSSPPLFIAPLKGNPIGKDFKS